MAGFKVPRYVELLDALPLNATGKVQKDRLRSARRKPCLRIPESEMMFPQQHEDLCAPDVPPGSGRAEGDNVVLLERRRHGGGQMPMGHRRGYPSAQNCPVEDQQDRSSV